MKPTRPPRPAPRTLAAAPPAQVRQPQPAAHTQRFPTLAVVLASGAALPACADPVCGTTRADELEAHGRMGVQAARGGEGSQALREIGIALGVVAHGTTRGTPRVPDMVPAGAMPVVNPTPPPRASDPIPMTGGGAVAPVTPAPVPPTPPAQVTTPGNDHPPARPGQMRRVTPTPPPTPPPRPRPEPGLAVPGGLGAVGPLPAQLSHPRITRT